MSISEIIAHLRIADGPQKPTVGMGAAVAKEVEVPIDVPQINLPRQRQASGTSGAFRGVATGAIAPPPRKWRGKGQKGQRKARKSNKSDQKLLNFRGFFKKSLGLAMLALAFPTEWSIFCPSFHYFDHPELPGEQ